MKLYELTESFTQIFDLLESDDDLNYEALEDTLQALEGAIEIKAGGIAKMIKALDGYQNTYTSESKRLAEKARTTGNKITWLKSYLLEAMTAVAKDKIMTDIGTVARQKSPPSVNVLDITKVPEGYFYSPPPPPPVTG